ncbi:MAG: VOC family protein [Planctomycetota bacterium]
MNTSTPITLTPDHICIGVADLDASIAWYERVLGFAVSIKWTVPELPGFRLAYLEKDGFRIELIDAGDHADHAVETMAFDQFLRTRGYSHVCFRVDDVDASMALIEAQGVVPELPPTDFPDVGRRVTFFRDIDGNYIELAGPMTSHDSSTA